MRSDLSEASSVMVEGGDAGERGSEAERKRKFLVSRYQEEWTPLRLSLAVGSVGEQRKWESERDRCLLIH